MKRKNNLYYRHASVNEIMISVIIVFYIVKNDA